MAISAESLTAVERARLAYEQLKRREYNAVMKRRARARTRNIALALTVVITLTLCIGVSIYEGWMPESFRSSAHDRRADNGSRSGKEGTIPVRSYVKGNTCQELNFSNEDGALVSGSFVPCRNESKRELPPFPGSTNKGAGARVNAIRDSFSR